MQLSSEICAYNFKIVKEFLKNLGASMEKRGESEKGAQGVNRGGSSDPIVAFRNIGEQRKLGELLYTARDR